MPPLPTHRGNRARVWTDALRGKFRNHQIRWTARYCRADETLRPDGAPDHGHGCSEGRRKPTEAQPVVPISFHDSS